MCADSFCKRCIHEAGVLLLPGSQFDVGTLCPFQDSFRVGYGRKSLPECLERLDTYAPLTLVPGRHGGPSTVRYFE